MSLLEKTMAELAAEYARKIEGLRRDAGRIAEAEALEKTIGEHMQGTDTWKPRALVTPHMGGKNSIILHVHARHDDFRAALAASGIAIESETDVSMPRKGIGREIHMRLVGFETLVDIEYDEMELRVAA